MNNNTQPIKVIDLPPKSELTNESEVEFKFLESILKWLGWKSENIMHKHSLGEFLCGLGTNQSMYRPDYVIQDDNKNPRLVLDAKSPTERLDKHTNQCASYCLHLNSEEEEDKIKYFVLSSGIQTTIYDRKGAKKILELKYEDFNKYTDKCKKFFSLLNPKALTKGKMQNKEDFLLFRKSTKEEAQKAFKNCHKYIWKAEKMGVNASFMEFVKLIFLKLDSDKKIHFQHKYEDDEDYMKIPKKEVLFSVSWIKDNTSDMQKNPMKDIQFRNLTDNLKKLIKKNAKKPLFDENETINLKATTILGVVQKLETMDLYGIDEDLNGRLFETFLNATMRGNDLGQYFTPRSIVKLGVALANIQVSKEHIDKVLDGSCGTGGFLIEAFTDMKKKILSIGNYTNREKDDMIVNLATDCVYGIDAAKDPKLARIARINMYLHGDGGSNIYMGDGLSLDMKPDETDTEEFRDEMESMQGNFPLESFDIVITNPPFSMTMSMENEQERKVLNGYELLSYGGSKKSLRTGVMFIERYEGLLKKGGKLISILDNTILNSPQYKFVRDYIRDKFNIKAIISLHGDAFQQSKARVKTSLIYLEKKMGNENQADAFMTFSTKLGVDDMPITTPQNIIDNARKEANEEIDKIIHDFHAFQKGENGIWRIPPDRLNERLDVKHCIPFKGRFIKKWHNDGYSTKKLCEIFSERKDFINPKQDNEAETFKILTIKYDGNNSIEEERLGGDIAGKGWIVKKGDLVMSRYNAYYGAIGYITEDEENAFASKSYIVLRPKNTIDGLYAWVVLRSAETRADLLDSAIGIGRSPIKWEEIKDVEIPYIDDESKRKFYTNRILESWEKIKMAKHELMDIKGELGNMFGTEGEESIYRFNANKPPK